MGTVTFLFTDGEGSTKLWAVDPAAMSSSLRVRDSIVRGSIESNGSHVFTTAGDSFAAAFPTTYLQRMGSRQNPLVTCPSC